MSVTANIDIQRAINETEAALKRHVKTVAITALEGVMQKSPMGNPRLWKYKAPPGYVGGHFRTNWQVGLNARPVGIVPGVDESGSAALSAGKAVINTYQVGQTIHITNNVPYAKRLENGWSTQAPPGGIVALTVAELS